MTPFELNGTNGPIGVSDDEWQLLAALAGAGGQYMPMPDVGHSPDQTRTAGSLLRARGLAAFSQGRGRATVLGMRAHHWREAGCPEPRRTSNHALLARLTELTR